MKKSKFSDSQIMSILKQAGAGVPVAELCREHGMSSATFYSWRSKYGGMELSDLKKMKRLAEENRRLKDLYAKVSLENIILQEAIEGKL